MSDLIEKFKVIYPEAENIGRSFCPYRVCLVRDILAINMK